MDKKYEVIRQMIIITDGRSDIGANHVEEAAKAKARGITVSVIGIVDDENIDEVNLMELEAISKAGGGLCDYCYTQNLGITLRSMTQNIINHTLKYIVSMQLKYISGQDMASIENKYRIKVVEFIKNYGERVDLLYGIVLNAGMSMNSKPELIEGCIMDLMESLNKRKGISKVALISYDGDISNTANVVCGFTTDMTKLKEGLQDINAGVKTNFGPIETTVDLTLDNFLGSRKEDNLAKCRIN